MEMSGFGHAAVSVARGMGFNELYRLDKHARGAAAGVIDPALVRLDHLYEDADHGARGVELTTLATLGECELLQEVFVNLSQHVRGPGLGSAHLDIAH